MKHQKKYILMFILEFLLFMGILLLLDWAANELNQWYTYVLQGLFFGVFMTLYSMWSDKRKENNGE